MSLPMKKPPRVKGTLFRRQPPPWRLQAKLEREALRRAADADQQGNVEQEPDAEKHRKKPPG